MPVKNRKPQGSPKPPEPELDDDATLSPSLSPTPPQERKKTKKRSLGLTFFIGGIAGLLLAGFAAKSPDSMQFISELRLDALVDVIPAGILKEATEISKQEKDAVGHESFQVGLALKAEGLTARHPVVMIPGVISTGQIGELGNR
ncbi:hypothetical protein HOY82DRAFT_103572 [Tuber indicum]|nr:hypothetical protein HOY82DRAFT_103572 [Tuber indicum]